VSTYIPIIRILGNAVLAILLGRMTGRVLDLLAEQDEDQ
jgi:hypothetical protein